MEFQYEQEALQEVMTCEGYEHIYEKNTTSTREIYFNILYGVR